jgi:hypothetical protein
MRGPYCFFAQTELAKLELDFNRNTDGRPKSGDGASRLLLESHSSENPLDPVRETLRAIAEVALLCGVIRQHTSPVVNSICADEFVAYRSRFDSNNDEEHRYPCARGSLVRLSGKVSCR